MSRLLNLISRFRARTLLAVCGVLVVALTLTARSRKPEHQSERASSTQAVLLPTNSVLTSSGTRLQTLVVMLTSNGFQPAEIEHSKDKFFLAVLNRSEIPGVRLVLDREVGNGHLKEVNIDTQKRRWADVLDLPPGRYVLSEASHPNWLCQITITPQ
jgi:hypothetical protein